MARRQDRGERGSALVIVILVVLALVGMGLMALQQTRTQAAAAGNQRVSRQAYEAAFAGLARVATKLSDPEKAKLYYDQAMTSRLANANEPFIFKEGSPDDSGFFPVENPLAAGDPDHDRIGDLEYHVEISQPRQLDPPPGFAIAGGTMDVLFYGYRLDAYGWVHREGGTSLLAAPGTGAARKQLAAEVRVGPIVTQKQ